MAGIIDMIIQIDEKLFTLINGIQLIPFVESILTYWRNAYVWGPLYTFIIAFAVFNFKNHAKWFIIFSLLTVSSTDFVSSKVIKTNVQRLRPCNTEQLEVINRVQCSTGYSFTSSHATNHFGLAAFWIFTLSFINRKFKTILWVWAAIIGFCQVFVGVHFPLDVLTGGILGTLIGWGYAQLFNNYYQVAQ
ncbi:MAG TPA: phosphatase PAP2 family protein [Saprospiraceae bacterium]|nr:phosphatase PAP2 family protein [Saprospiraceae bacterium]